MLNPSEQSIYFYAMRYMLGRMSAGVSEVCTELIDKSKEFSPDLRTKMAREITKAIYFDEIGMACDRDNWIEVIKILLIDNIPSNHQHHLI